MLLWEIFSLGKVPYPQIDNDDLVNYIQEGNRMEQPKFAPDDMLVSSKIVTVAILVDILIANMVFSFYRS